MESATVQASAHISGTASSSLSGSCFLTAVTLKITDGDLIVPTTNGQDVHFAGTQVAIEHIKFADDCVPQLYELSFNGPAVLMGSAGQPIAVDFNDLIVEVDWSGDFTQIGIEGDLSAACFGGRASLKTQPDLSIFPGNPIPARSWRRFPAAPWRRSTTSPEACRSTRTATGLSSSSRQTASTPAC